MTETTEKKEIVPTLRKMAVGECEVFPLSQARSIGSTIYQSDFHSAPPVLCERIQMVRENQYRKENGDSNQNPVI